MSIRFSRFESYYSKVLEFSSPAIKWSPYFVRVEKNGMLQKSATGIISIVTTLDCKWFLLRPKWNMEKMTLSLSKSKNLEFVPKFISIDIPVHPSQTKGLIIS